jgi:hypothetical protein
MTTRNPTPPPDDDALNEFVGMAPEQVAAFVFREGGEQALRQTLQMADEPEPHNREDLEQIASALELRGLDAPAGIVRQIAADTPSGIEFNPYPKGSVNWSEWRRSWIGRQRQATGEIERSLRQRMSGKSRKHRTNGTKQH